MEFKVSNVPFYKRVIYFLEEYWKRILLLTGAGVALLLIIAFTFCDPSTSFKEKADSTGDPFWTGDYSANREGLGETVVSMYKEIYTGGAIEDLSQKLSISVDDSGLTVGNQKLEVGNIFTNVNDILVEVAISVFMILWVSSMMTAFINQQNYTELIIKKFIVLGVGIFLICKANYLCQELCNIGSALVTEISSGVTESMDDGSGQVDALWDQLNDVAGYAADVAETEVDEDAGLLSKLGAYLGNMFTTAFSRFGRMMKVKLANPLKYMVVLLLPWIGVKISKAICSVFVYTRAVEIAVLCALSPIPFALITNEPFGNGAGARFLKNVAAVSIQGAVMMMIFLVCNAMVSGLAGGEVTIEALSTGTMSVLAVYFAEIGLLMKSLSMSQKVLGLA